MADQFTPDQLNIINELDGRRSTLSPDQIQVLDELKGRMNPQGPAFNQSNSDFPFLGNMVDAIGTGIQDRLNGLGNLFGALTNTDNLKHLAQNPIKDPATVGLNVLEQLGEGMRQQQRQGLQQMQTDPMGGVLRMISGSVPGIGPAVNQWVDKLGQDPGGATGDAIMTGVDLAGPKLAEMFGAPERAIGSALYKGSLNFPQDVSLAERAKIKQLGLDLQIPTTGQKAIDFLGDTTNPNSFMGHLEQGVQGQIAKVRTQPVNMMKILQPLYDEIQSIDPRAPGANEIRKTMTTALQDQLKKFGWTKKTPVMSPITVEEAQKLKRDTYRMLSDRYYGDKANASNIPGQKQAYMKIAEGLKNSIEDKAPGVKQYNDTMHHTIQLQDALIDAEKSHPGWLKTWGRYIAGASGGLLGAGIAESSGHPMMGAAGLAGILAATVARDPAAASRLGLVLTHAGRDPISFGLGLMPGAGHVGAQLPPNSQ